MWAVIFADGINNRYHWTYETERAAREAARVFPANGYTLIAVRRI